MTAAASLRRNASCRDHVSMNGHLREDRLHEYVEDLLCREERAEVEKHLVRCEQCRAVVKRLRDRRRDVTS
ncbi:MAG: anti-sigma factor family protein [Longimicrobiales bacterium]